MYKLNKDTFGTYKEFFFFGIDKSGEKQLFEAFIYFSYMNEIRKKHEEEVKTIYYMPDTLCMPIDYRQKYTKQEVIEYEKRMEKQIAITQKKATGEEILEETIQRAKQIALQYERFVTLNGKIDVLANYNKSQRIKDEEQLEKKIRKVVKSKIEDGSMKIEEYGLNIFEQWFNNFMHYPEYSIPEAQGFILRNWTEEVYDILCYLEKAEQSNPMGYYDLWLRTRIERFKSENIKAREKVQKFKENNSNNWNKIEKIEKSIDENKQEIERIISIWNKVRKLRLKENSLGVDNDNLIINEMDTK